MPETYKVKIVVPGGVIFEDSGVINLFAAGVEGELEILPGHTDLLTPLRVSHLEVLKRGDARSPRRRWSVAGGILQVSREGVVVISPAAERADKIDVERAEAARDRARKRLGGEDKEIDSERARQALVRAEVRLKAASFNQDNPEE